MTHSRHAGPDPASIPASSLRGRRLRQSMAPDLMDCFTAFAMTKQAPQRQLQPPNPNPRILKRLGIKAGLHINKTPALDQLALKVFYR